MKRTFRKAGCLWEPSQGALRRTRSHHVRARGSPRAPNGAAGILGRTTARNPGNAYDVGVSGQEKQMLRDAHKGVETMSAAAAAVKEERWADAERNLQELQEIAAKLIREVAEKKRSG